ncbi:MAG: hypothetical protein NZ954_00340 [Thermofilaceae archaeon]|nr:hypothetical protein [Thermofilaceae archaeon]MCX8180372.1 hypothetical protein [Thermofilaceae archaeon]MDW8003907.1 hypothetical protein [Thermofilaceae archaeon]
MNDETKNIASQLLKENKYPHILVLVFLFREGKATLSNIQRALAGGRYRAQYNWTLGVLNDLKNIGLVAEEKIQFTKFKVRVFYLTERGKLLGEYFAKVMNI